MEVGFMRYSARERFDGATAVPHVSVPCFPLGLTREVTALPDGRYMGRERRWSGVDAAALSVFETEAGAIAWANMKGVL